MKNIEVKFEENMDDPFVASASIEGNKKVIYISDLIRGAFPGYLNAAIGHEKVHLKGENDYFLFDECNLGYIFGYLDVPKLLKKYNFPDWEKKLENEYETAKELARFHRQCVNLIAYHEASNEETKNWILLSPYINDEVLDFINEKKDESGKFTKKK